MKDASNCLCVLDASRAIGWLLPDEASESSQPLDLASGRSEALVPAYWPAEMLNALLVAVRKQRFPDTDPEGICQLITQLPFRVGDISPSEWNDWMATAERHRLTIYDAGYLYLAEKHRLPLATADKALIRAAEAIGIGLIES